MTTEKPTQDDLAKLEALGELVDATVALVHSVNSPRGSKGAIDRQERAVRKAGKALLGRKPTTEECQLIDQEYTA